ncbi:MAG TPA: GNAT family N-acetyltransferase [Aurantimonas sp.]|uniref:GNAT family N-acetyltransferase n=1 Tax=Aurantimonas marianensis TaxID=2920428 RepID=A0A9X2KGX5_9HYPH|nr:GNAT family N-acetyltransferase [Aurantimonas marianensis]MCP3056815.1 GNAT family N-acetyltransferase [Aurantimonas marianensis]
MTLPDGFTPIAPGKIAAIATVLEMTAPPAPVSAEAAPADTPWRLDPIPTPDPCWYEDLYRRVGAAHLWYSRLALPAEARRATIQHPDIAIHALCVEGRAEGIVELDFRETESCELVFFGVTEPLIGTGAARYMMGRAIAIAFARPIARLWLHTNTMDHPKAMAFYRRSGFRPVRQMVEIADDPRLTGLFAPETTPRVPIFPAG